MKRTSRFIGLVKFILVVLTVLFFVFQTVSISAQQTPPLLNWVKTNEHLKLKKCIDTLEYGIKKIA